MNNKKVLIVTDEITDYSRIRSLLEDFNIKINHRSSLNEAYRLTKYQDFDLIIFEIDVPKFRTKHVNLIRKLSNKCYVVNIVNSIGERAFEECLKLDCIILKKPIIDETLLSHVKQILFNGEDDIYNELTITDSCLEDSPFCDSENYAEG